MKRIFTFTLCAAFTSIFAPAGQAQSTGQPMGHGNHARALQTTQGPHGGTLRQTAGLQIETVADVGGLKLFVYDRAGKPALPTQARGVASLQVRGGAKRYRYDLLPDGQGALMAPVNLSNIAGHQIEVDFQLVGLTTVGTDRITFSEVTTVPASSQQVAATAIARQKVCPVSGKPLGSMGSPVAVDANGDTVYVCCAGCVAAVKANTAKYAAAGRSKVTVAQATAADGRLIAQQARCPVMDEPLGSMGHPVKVMVGDKPIFLCCKGCIKKVEAEPAKYLAMVYGRSDAATVPAGGAAVREGVFKVAAADAPFIAAQKRCPVMDEPLDAMGGPYKVEADGRAIYICCPGCAKKIAAEPQKYLAVLAQQGVEAPVLR